MGGYGSGRSGGRPIADSASKIDLPWMVRTGKVREGSWITGTLHWTWSDGSSAGSISYTARMDEPGNERLELSYTRGTGDTKESVRQTVRLESTRPHYGGKRWWMICPYRHVQVSKLYLPSGGDRFASRQAWRIGYRCQRVAQRDRASEALFKLQRKLSCEQGWGGWPARPKGMWQRTYERHLARFEQLDAQVAVEMMALIGLLDGKGKLRGRS